MVYLFLCIFLIGTVQGVSLFDLEVKYNGIKTILEKDHETIKQLNAEIAKDRETTRQLKLENIELRKELVNSQQRSGSLNSIEELIETLAVVSSNLEMIKSGQETEKMERHGILADLGQIKQWTTNLIAKTERGWTNALAKFTTENRDKQSDYEEFKKQSSNEWDQWRNETNGTLSGIEAGCEETKSDFQRQNIQLENRIDGLEKSIKCLQTDYETVLEKSSNSYCFKDCETGCVKDGCSCYSLPNSPPNLSYYEAINKCVGSGARLIEPREVTQDKFNGYIYMWTGVGSKDGGNHWSYQNGTEAKGLAIGKDFWGEKQCVKAKVIQGSITFFAGSCASYYYVICVKS